MLPVRPLLRRCQVPTYLLHVKNVTTGETSLRLPSDEDATTIANGLSLCGRMYLCCNINIPLAQADADFIELESRSLPVHATKNNID